MAIEVEDGTGKADAESYVSVAAADAYHAARGNTGWTGADAAKEAALRKATSYLDGRFRGRWRGRRGSQEQALAWPRTSVIDEDRFEVASDVVPAPLIVATVEAALLILGGTDLSPALERGGLVESESVEVGPISESKTYVAGAPARVVPTMIDDALKGLLAGATGGGMVFLDRA